MHLRDMGWATNMCFYSDGAVTIASQTRFPFKVSYVFTPMLLSRPRHSHLKHTASPPPQSETLRRCTLRYGSVP